ncbi:class I SAM-dependent methyltransferase [Clostridium sp. KNHs205]|jgi:cephalosporin hydroxylase|uniref:class I SAM-dependent methyltransferase n=1 Tax=Clostridium sp. KNHs205 TaxID=1449050 RepID=UPI00051C56B8|nr:class I SAM-dependent methyltransferase [Clostridium sp. KNHs205]
MEQNMAWMNQVQEIALLYPEEIRFLSNLPVEVQDKDGLIVDIGTFKGGSSITLAMGLKQNGIKEKVYTVDSYEYFTFGDEDQEDEDGDWGRDGKMRTAFLENVKKFHLEDDIVSVFSDSTSYLNQTDASIKLMFYDGSNMADKVSEDLFLAASKIVYGGYICLHDFHDVEIYGGNVKKAVDKFLKERHEFEFVKKIGETGVIRKKEGWHE